MKFRWHNVILEGRRAIAHGITAFTGTFIATSWTDANIWQQAAMAAGGALVAGGLRCLEAFARAVDPDNIEG